MVAPASPKFASLMGAMWINLPSGTVPTSKSSATKTYLPHYQTPLKFAPEWGIFLLGKFGTKTIEAAIF